MEGVEGVCAVRFKKVFLLRRLERKGRSIQVKMNNELPTPFPVSAPPEPSKLLGAHAKLI